MPKNVPSRFGKRAIDAGFLILSILAVGWMGVVKRSNSLPQVGGESSLSSATIRSDNDESGFDPRLAKKNGPNPELLRLNRAVPQVTLPGNELNEGQPSLSEQIDTENDREEESLDRSRQELFELGTQQHEMHSKSAIPAAPSLAFPYGDLNDFPPAVVSVEELTDE